MTNRIDKAQIWNMLGFMSVNVSPFFLMLVVSRVFSLETTGAFGIAYTNSLILYSFGSLGIDHYQMTDYGNRYTLSVYLSSRVFLCAIMLLICFSIHPFFNRQQMSLTFLLTVLMCVNAFSGCFGCHLFRDDMLELYGKTLFYRVFSYTVAFSAVSILANSIELAIFVAIVTNLLTTYFVLIEKTAPLYGFGFSKNFNEILNLIKDSFPIIATLLLFTLLANCYRYSVAYYLDDKTLGVFSIIMLFAPVLNTFCSPIYFGQLGKISSQANKVRKDFVKYLGYIMAIIIFIAFIEILGIYFWGVELIGTVYNVDISFAKTELMIITGFSLFHTLGMFFYLVILTLRRQWLILLNCFLTALLAIALSFALTKHFGVRGAVYAYAIAYVASFLGFSMILTHYVCDGRAQR